MRPTIYDNMKKAFGLPFVEQVYFGTTAGQLIVMDVHGAMVSEVQLAAGVTSMAWSAEKFKMEEGDDDVSGNTAQQGKLNCRRGPRRPRNPD